MQSPILPQTSKDFAIVEYILQMQLDASQFKIDEMRDITSRHQVNNFNNYVKKMKNANVVETFVLLKDIQQPLSDIAGHGLRIPVNTGFKFQLGHFDIPEGQEKYEALHLFVALGTVLNYQDYESELDQTLFLNAEPTVEDLKGHDSIYCGNNTYYVFSQAQIKAAHFISFKGGDNLKKDKHVICKCGVCGKDNATLWCESDCIKLCPECDKKTHNSNPLFQSHVRVPLREGLPKTQMCPFHPDQVCLYYCQKCHIGVCVECKINGHHSHGEAAKHKLIPLAQAYNEAHANVIATNTTYVTRQKIIENDIEAADDKLQEIMDNAEAVEKEIQRIAEEAIASVKKQAQDRAVIVKSAKSELERKLAELEKQKEFIHIMDETAEPSDFLRYFACSKDLEEEMKPGKDLPLPLTVSGDLVVYGKLEVSKPHLGPTDTLTTEEPNLQGFEVQNRDIPTSETGSTMSTTTTTESQMTGPSASVTENSVLERQPKFSRLSKIATRKEDRLKQAGTPLTFVPFKESEILTDDQEKKTVYLTLPFKGVPDTHLMFSTTRDGRSISKMHKMIDDKGITLILVRSAGYTFGGFAAAKWNCDGVPFGDQSSCFLFSLTNDAFIPAHGQSEEPCKLFATQDTLTFGKEDLKLAGNFDYCSSHIENTYGVGLVYGGTKAGTFLAGYPEFAADVVEVWGFFSSE